MSATATHALVLRVSHGNFPDILLRAHDGRSAGGGAVAHGPAVSAHDSSGPDCDPDPREVGGDCLCHTTFQPPPRCGLLAHSQKRTIAVVSAMQVQFESAGQ